MSISHQSGKVKMSLCLIWHLAMKTCGGIVVWLHALLTPDGVTGQIDTQKSNLYFLQKGNLYFLQKGNLYFLQLSHLHFTQSKISHQKI